MKAGRMRHKIVIETNTQARTSTGSLTDSWATHATVRCNVEPLSSREYFAADSVNTANQTKFQIRNLSTVTTKMRILWGSRYFDIQSIIVPREIKHEMLLVGVEYEGRS